MDSVLVSLQLLLIMFLRPQSVKRKREDDVDGMLSLGSQTSSSTLEYVSRIDLFNYLYVYIFRLFP